MLPLVQELNPSLQEEVLRSRFQEMFSYPSYRCFGLVDEEDKLIGISSGWLSTRLYSGKQLELDNVVIAPEFRSKGYGKVLDELLEQWARDNNCLTMELNSYVSNNRSHRFYINRNYDILGYHFLKKLKTPENQG